MGQGSLVLVVGPSGAGKDTLIAAARDVLAGDDRFVFVRRVVTRDAVAEFEDHETIDREGFVSARARGDFALDWEAHGLRYALPGSIEAALAEGRVVVANVSRRVVAEALSRFARARVVVVTADAAIRAQRLAGRGRESAEEVASRLGREGAPVPAGIAPVVIDNSGTLQTGIDAFTVALRAMASG